MELSPSQEQLLRKLHGQTLKERERAIVRFAEKVAVVG
jgi:hypothetical protein